MRNQKIDIPVMIVTFLVPLAFLSWLIYAYAYIEGPGWITDCLGVSITLTVTAACTVAALFLTNKLRKQIKLTLPKMLSGFTALMLVLLFVLSFAGQVVYALDTKTYEVKVGEHEEKETVEYSENADIVILLDLSASMNVYKNAALTACNNLLQNISPNCRIGGGAFGSNISYTELAIQKADKDGLTKIERAINEEYAPNGFVMGGTDIENALKTAKADLDAHSSKDKNRALILISDMEDYTMDKSLFKTYHDEGIDIYLILPTSRAWLDQLISANVDGIFDMSGDKGSANAILDALNAVTQKKEERVTIVPDYETKTDIVLNNGLILYDNVNEQNLYRIIVRLVCFILFTFILQMLFFRRFSLSAVLFSIGSAVLSCALVTLGSVLHVGIICSAALALLMFTLIIKSGKSPTDES